MQGDLHRELTVIDGLIVSNWGREVFEAMHAGGITAANCTSCVWEDLPTTIKATAQWKKWLRENDDILQQIYTTADIRRAKADNKVGIILGWQNTSGFGDSLPMVSVYHELGLRIVQLTYNTANSVGSGCYEGKDGGLTDFGRELVDELNRCGILVDLSHVGPNTSRDAILHSKQPVAYSHCLPAGMKAHPRNKTDEELRFIADKGGFVGVTMFPPFLPKGSKSTVDDFIGSLEYMLNVVGEDQIGIGTDFTQGYGDEFFRYITDDKGYARSLTQFGPIEMPEGFRRIEEYPNLTRAMERKGWSRSRIEKVMGENWLAMLKTVWGA